MFKKKIISVISLLTAASLLVSCGKSALPERQTEADKISELNVSAENRTEPEVFSELTVSKNGQISADGQWTGQSCCGFTLQDDGSITVFVDGKELPFEEAAEKTGCTLTENSDGSLNIQAPFQKSQVIVSSDRKFETYGAESVEETVKDHFLLTYSSPTEAYSAYQKLSVDENIEFAEPNAVYKSAGFNETKRIENWGLERIGAADFCKELSEKNEDLPDVCVAVIDSGIYYEHSIFEGRILDGGRNFCKNYSEDKVNSASDDNGHGTHCAGIICSSTNDNVRILPVKVLDYMGFGDTYDIYCGMMYAVEYGADIISMSLGGYGKSHLFSEAVSAAYDKGITVCVAAGNESAGCESEYSSVSSIEECVVVASVDSELAPSDFSNYENIDFAAPGEYILSAGIHDPDDTAEMSGTSMATPFVAACFADVLSADRDLSSEELYDIVKANSVDLCEPGYDDRTGWGMVNLKKFRMTTERVDDPELRPAEVPSDPSPDDPPKEDVNFSSDDIIIEEGVLTKCNVYGDVLDLKKLVNDKVIPDFYEIGTEAFKDSSIKELILPDSVRRIEKYAFYNCSKLRKVETKAEYLGRSAFEGCFSLKEFSDSYVKELDEMVFTGCTSFETADFTKVTEIPAYAFTDCRKLKNESFCFENILLAGEKAFSRSGISGTVDMSSVKWLGSAAFSETALREITLSDSIEYLPSELFYNCSNLMKISAPSVTEIYDKALALEKNVLSAETAVETDIDFSKVTYLGLEDTFSGFVFDRPVSFDSLSGYLSLSSISGAYGELLSFPNVKTVCNDYTFYANLSADAVCFESVKSLDLEHSCCPCFIGVGDSLESIRIDWDDPDVWICSLNDNPDVADVLKQERVLYHKPSELYLSEIRTEVFSVYPWHLSAVIPGEHLTYSYTVTSCETGEVIRSVEDSDYPVNFVPLFEGNYIVDTEIKDHSGNTVFSESIQVSQPGYYYETAETDSQIIIDNNDPDTEYCDIVSFTPESDGEYWLEYSGIAVNIYTKEGLLLTDYDNSEKLSLKGGETYITEITTDDPVIYISFMSSQTDLKNINTALWNGEAYAFSDSEGEIYTEVFLYDRTMLTEGVDYRTIISELYYEHYEVTVIGMGEYYGIYQFSYDLLPLAKLNSRTDTKQYSVDFIPEKSGIYKIMFMPSEEAMENAVAENSCLADFNLECDVICYNDDPNGFDYLQEYTVTGQSEISVYLNEGFRYKLYNSCLNYDTIQQVIITDKPSLSQCDAEYTFSYELNGESVYPDIRFTDNGKVLAEGTDYKLTVWKNTCSGLMFAVAEGCGDYSGIRNFAMVIEGEDLKAGKSDGDNVIDVKPDTKFEYLGALKYRITFERDTFVNINCSSPVFAKFTGQDAMFRKDNYEDYVFVKKGTYFFELKDYEFSDDYIYSNGITVKTNDDMISFSDTDIKIIYGKDGKPEISVFYEGELLEKGTDYTVRKNSKDTVAVINGINRFCGEIIIGLTDLPETDDDVTLYTGKNIIDKNRSLKYIFTAEEEKYYFVSSAYINSDVIVTDEKGVQIWRGIINSKNEAEIFFEKGRSYFIYVKYNFTDTFELYIKTEGRLSECEAEYEKMIPFDPDNEIPKVIFKDGDYVLEEGKDYFLLDNGSVNDAGLHEYVYKGCGKYFGEVLIPFLTYRETIDLSEDYYEAEIGEKYTYSFTYIGDTMKFKITNDSDKDMIYHVVFISEFNSGLEFLNVFLYDQDGKFTGANNDVTDFTIEKGRTAYLLVVPPYYCDDDNKYLAYMADVKILSEETEASEQPGNISELSGDVNCDGTVDLFDLMRLKRYLLGTIKLSEQGRKNAMLAGTENREEPDAGDLLMLKNILLAV